MNFKLNLNKIDYNLKKLFQKINITEKYNRNITEYVELVIENKDNLVCKTIIPKRNLNNDIFEWYYYDNPNEQENLIEKKSDIESFSKDIKEIFDKKMFNKNYLEK